MAGYTPAGYFAGEQSIPTLETRLEELEAKMDTVGEILLDVAKLFGFKRKVQ